MSGGELFVVDDNPGNIRFIEEAFTVLELTPTIHTANTRDEALDFIHRRNEYEDTPRLDVVLLDWRLSQTTGKEVLDAAKSVTPPIPVVIMTSSKTQMESENASVSRADKIIEKPTEPEKYVELLRPYLTAQ
ncbi:response regulator [Natronorubrum sp. FCH18a]|uniref:response regulator n=1 Tax=Natronorubrum sp. FCH18a TaxID=3447018 RepID=UPI003F515F08